MAPALDAAVFSDLDARSMVVRDAGGSDPQDIIYEIGLAGVNQTSNYLMVNWLWGSMGVLGALILIGRFLQMRYNQQRHLHNLTASAKQQTYWGNNHGSFWPKFKKNLLYAPLVHKRHNREIRLSAAGNVGTIPSRFHSVLLIGYLAINMYYTFSLDYSQEKGALLAEARGRSGVLSVMNMIPLFLFAGRNNPLITMLRVSFDTYNLLHRWMGRIVALEAIIHTFVWGWNVWDAQGFPKIQELVTTDAFIIWGVVGTVALTFIVIQACSPLRHAFYETFLHLHQLSAFVAWLGIYYHIKVDALPQLQVLQLIIGMWAADRFVRLARLTYLNFSRQGCSKVIVQALPGEACRVTFNLQRYWHFKPGQHGYVYFPSISLWMSHPFSIAWIENHHVHNPDSPDLSRASTATDLEKAVANVTELKDLPPSPKTGSSVSFVIAARTGMTRKLYNKASASPNSTIYINGFVEGPYSGHDSLHSYGSVLLFAGGIGITHAVPHLRDLITGYNNGTVATRKVTLVWTVRSTEHLEWVRPWMDQILAMPGRREILKILIFVTKPKSPREVVSPSATVQMYPGRLDPEVVMEQQVRERIGALGVSVCGPGALGDGVRAAVRKHLEAGVVDFTEEAFTW